MTDPTPPPPDALPTVVVTSPQEPPGRRRWVLTLEILGAIAAITAVVFTTLAYVAPRAAPAPRTRPDESLELVTLAVGRATTDVPVLGEVDPGGPIPTPGASPATGETLPRRAVTATLRNSTDDTAVLTGVKVVVTARLVTPRCRLGGTGGATVPSLNYDFRFPENADLPWTATDPQGFQVAPHAVDEFSVTTGPEVATDVGYLWKFSVYAVSTHGREYHWGDAVWMDPDSPGPAQIWQYVLARNAFSPGTDGERRCATKAVSQMTGFLGSTPLVHPGVTTLLDAYRRLADA